RHRATAGTGGGHPDIVRILARGVDQARSVVVGQDSESDIVGCQRPLQGPGALGHALCCRRAAVTGVPAHRPAGVHQEHDLDVQRIFDTLPPLVKDVVQRLPGLPPSEAPGVDAAPVGVGDPSRVGGHSDLGQDLLHIPGQAAGQVGHRLPVGVPGEPGPELVGGAVDLQLHLVVELAQVLLRLGLGLGVCHPGLLLDSLGPVVPVGAVGCAGSAAALAPARPGLVTLATSPAVAGLALSLAALLAPAMGTGPVALLVAVLATGLAIAGIVLPGLVAGHLFGGTARASSVSFVVLGLVVLV